MTTGLPTGIYKRCTCADQRACDHSFWVTYKKEGQPNARASVDKLVKHKNVRDVKGAAIVRAAFINGIENGSYVPGRKLESEGPDLAFAMDCYIERHYVGTGMVLVPLRARKRRDDESYLNWLYDVLAPENFEHFDDRERAESDRKRLSVPRRIVARLGGTRPIASVARGDIDEFVTELEEPAKFTERSREELPRATSTLNRIKCVIIHFFDWLTVNGPSVKSKTPILAKSPCCLDNGKLMVHQESEDNERTRRCPIEEEARLHQVASPRLSELIAFSIDSLMRKGELRRLRVADVLERADWVRVVGSVRKKQQRQERATLQRVGARVNKTGKERWMPVTTDRMAATIERHLVDASGRRKASHEYLFCDGTGERPIADWEHEWEIAKLRANGWVTRAQFREMAARGESVVGVKVITWRKAENGRGNAGLSLECMAALDEIDLRYHDLRAEGISRLAENPEISETEIGEMAGNPSCVARYIRLIRCNPKMAKRARCMNASAETVFTLIAQLPEEVTRQDAA